MKKLLLTTLIAVLAVPYLCFGTKIEQARDAHFNYNCTLFDGGKVKEYVSLGEASYSPFRHSNYSRMLVPYFFFNEEVVMARCGETSFKFLKDKDFFAPGKKINIYTNLSIFYVFGIKVHEEQEFSSGGDGWNGDIEGEQIANVLIDDKEIKMFHGKVIK